jgi:hypothetical protein
VTVWPIVRMRVFNELSLRTGLHGVAHPVRRSTADKASLVGRHVGSLAGANPFLARGSYDALLVPHPRKPDGQDIYSERVRAGLGDRLLVVDTRINGDGLLPGATTLDFFISSANAEARQRARRGLPPGDAERAAAVTDALERRTGARMPLAGVVARELTKHHRLRALYRALLRRHGIRTVYLVVSYFQQHVTGAAKDLGLPVVELQHGAITPYHLGYSYPGRPEVPGSPDQLWCFGSYWAETVDLPAGTSTEVVGAPFIRPLTEAAKDPHLVVVASQGTIGAQLLPVARTLAELRPELQVVFRPHPSEHLSDYLASPAAADPPANLRITDAESTLSLQTRATYQVGVSTTALFEGMVLGCRTAVAKLPGWEYLQPAVERGDALLAADGAELARRLDDAPPCHDTTAYYAPPTPMPFIGRKR